MHFRSLFFVLILILSSFSICYKISKSNLKLDQSRCDDSVTNIATDVAGLSDLNNNTPSSNIFNDILGSAAQFAVLGASATTSTGNTVLTGSIGVYPGTSMTGTINFTEGKVLSSDDAMLAQIDSLKAYNTLTALTGAVSKQGVDLGGLILNPGIYSFNSSAALTGVLFLDAQGDSNAIWVFQIGSTLTAATGSKVIMINQGSALNVYWLIGTSLTILANCEMSGNMLVSVSATINTEASLVGRVLARAGAVTMHSNKIGFS